MTKQTPSQNQQKKKKKEKNHYILHISKAKNPLRR
jgi:hypothetical protein